MILVIQNRLSLTVFNLGDIQLLNDKAFIYLKVNFCSFGMLICQINIQSVNKAKLIFTKTKLMSDW